MTTTRRILFACGALAVALLVSTAATAQTPLSFSKAFGPDTIGPGSVSALKFDIGNTAPTTVASVAFTDNLPAGVAIASPANVSSTCDGTVSAPDGGSTISLSDGQLAANGTCSISVDVTSSTPGTHTNVTGPLTPGGLTATADLTVDTGRPGFTKSFSPSAVFYGGRSTLTLAIDNSASTAVAADLSFTDSLPPGMVIASPTNKATDCPNSRVSATAGGSTISLSPITFPSVLGAGATCTVTVDVLGNAVGALGNTTGELTSAPGAFDPDRSSGKASAVLTGSASKLLLTKTFVDDPVAPGDTVDLEFTIRNLDRGFEATGITFEDNLGAALGGLDVTGTLPTNPCGDGSSLSSTAGVLTLSDGILGINSGLADEGICTFTVTLEVPPGAVGGASANTTGPISGLINGDTETGDPASDVLFVEPAPRLTATFLGDPYASGESVELEFSVTNTDPASAISDIAFIDELTAGSGDGGVSTGFLPFPLAVTLPPIPDPPCGAGSALALVSLGADRQGLSLTGGSLAATGTTGDSCTFKVTLDLPTDLAGGTYTDTTGEITATVDGSGETVTGKPASDSLDVVAPPALLKEFIDDPAEPGGTVTLQFTVTYDANGDGFVDFDVLGGATAISFSDDLDAVLPDGGLVYNGGTVADVCGAGSQLTGTSTITLTGGSLDPDENDPSTFGCVFSLTLDVPSDAAAGIHTNTTSNLTATVSSKNAIGNAASGELRIAGLTLSKEFTDDPAFAGGTVDLSFTIDNISPTDDATAISFEDDLDEVLDGLVVDVGSVPTDPCGTGSLITLSAGNTVITLTGGNLLAGQDCTFSLTLDVPAGAAPDTYVNRTADFSATVGTSATLIAFDNASDELTVVTASDFLTLAKEFTDDPVAPGGTATLRFTLTNLSDSDAVTDIAFSDDLTSTLAGLAATGLPATGCNGTVSGTDTISLTGGSLAAGASCSFDVSLSVPAEAILGTYPNTTSDVTGTVGSFAVTGDPATDDLDVDVVVVTFSKSFDDEPLAVTGLCSQSGESCMVNADCPGFAEGDFCQTATVGLTFNIQNQSTTQSVESLSFTDNLDDVLPGLTALGLPSSDGCGASSRLEGTSEIALITGNLLPGGECTFTVQLEIPASAVAGSYSNVTSDLLQDGVPVADPATATLVVVAPPATDTDGDGVADPDDVCAGTVLPESVPTKRLGNNRYAINPLFDPDPAAPYFTFRYGGGPGPTYTTADTAGCSCEQIIDALGLGQGHVKFGCTKGVMQGWVAQVGGGGTSAASANGRGEDATDSRDAGPPVVDTLRGPSLTVEIVGTGSVTGDQWRWVGDRAIGMACGGTCRVKFEAGTEVKLMARPDGTAQFAGWSGDCYGDSPITTVVLNADSVCRALFLEQ